MRSPEARLQRIEKSIPPPSGSPVIIGKVPNVIDFVTLPEFLGRPRIYPGQATVLKVIFLADELFTDFDHSRLAAWGAGQIGGLEVNGQYGVPSDLHERIAVNKAAGRHWFREVAFAGGRRGGKGYIGSLAVAYIIWQYLATGDPQEHFGIAPGRPLTVSTWAQSKDQARDVFWRDLVAVIQEAFCFRPFVAEKRADRMLLWSPAQLAQPLASRSSPAIEIVARESTESAARGYASPVQVHDEVAHAVATGSARSAEDIHETTSPAQAQFGSEAFTYMPSSPREQTGRFFEIHQLGLARNADGSPAHPEILSLQFPSWELYEDWERWEEIPLYPRGQVSAPIRRAVISESDPDVQRVRLINPETFRVEFLANWAETQIPFLDRVVVMAIRDVYEGRHLEIRLSGERKHRYFGHGDLSLTIDNTALMIVHPEVFDDPGRPHIFIDYAEHWSPSDFHSGHIDLTTIETITKQRLHDFSSIERLTFDSYQSAGMIDRLKEYAQGRGMHTHIGEFSPNRQKAREIAETTKVALYERRIHAPDYPLLVDELLYLQDLGDRVDHPSTGPVITNDLVTCLFAVVAAITEATQDPGARFSSLTLRSMRWPITASDQRVFDTLGGGSRGRLGSEGGQRRETPRDQRRRRLR